MSHPVRDYVPAPEQSFGSNNVDRNLLTFGLYELCTLAAKIEGLEKMDAFDMLALADSRIGVPEFHSNKRLGRFLQIRRFLIQEWWHERRVRKNVRRWDRKLLDVEL